MNIRVDLHCHSSYSDGVLSPEQLAEKLAAAGVRLAALTDHDTTAGQKSFSNALKTFGIQTITGVELTVHFYGETLHLLAYRFNADDDSFQKMLSFLRNPLMGTIRHKVSRFFGLSSSETADSSIHDRGELSTIMDCVHQAGGRVFLAHPLDWRADFQCLNSALPELAAQGLDGIEAWYKPYSPEDQKALMQLAAQHDLLVCAGSDFHGGFRHVGITPGHEMPEEQFDRFLNALN